jgi:hypothetical protein
MTCDCIDKVNTQLKAQGQALVFAFIPPELRTSLYILTRPLVKRKAPAHVIASFCPFCGKPTEAVPNQPDPFGLV